MPVISNALNLDARVFFKTRIAAQRMAVPLQDPQDVPLTAPPINMRFQPSSRICRSRSSPPKFVIACHSSQKVSLCTQTDSGTNVSVRNKTVPILKGFDIWQTPCASSEVSHPPFRDWYLNTELWVTEQFYTTWNQVRRST